MEQFFVDYLERLDNILHGFAELVDAVPSEALTWSPGPDINSLAVLITHITGSTRFWIGDVALGELSNRVRDTEFSSPATDAATLKMRLTSTSTYAHEGLQRLTLADLDKIRPTPDDEAEYTVAWALLHALEHVGLHAGHAQITRQLWEQHNG